jgi:hypothetical protein
MGGADESVQSWEQKTQDHHALITEGVMFSSLHEFPQNALQK